ncbi:MAG: prolyl oligopeptidase family serine peptidase [Armatimonadaceae bacterium]
MNYPETKIEDVVETLHGVEVRDPYRWLEEANSDETRSWITAQNALTFSYLSEIPERERIQKRLTALWDYEKFSLPYKEGGRYFYSRNDGLQNQFVLMVAESPDDTGRVLLDPNTLSPDGTVALSGTAVSEDGKYLAYGISEAGSDWQQWFVRDIETGEDQTDHLRWIKFSGAAWTKDSKGFFYSRYSEPQEGQAFQETNYFRKLYYHQVGEPQEHDTLIYERPDQKEWGINGDVTEDGKYLLLYISVGTERKNRIFVKDLTGGDNPVVEWLAKGDALYNVIDNDGSRFYVLTDHSAPRRRIVAIDLDKPEPEDWETILPEGDDTLLYASLYKDQIIAVYLKDAHSQVRVYRLDGTHLRDIELPGIGSVGGFGGKRNEREKFYSFSSFTTPPTIYRYDMETGESTLYRQAKVRFNPEDFETRQVFYTSKDGTRVPMFITHKKGLTLDGTNPTFLYGYGGFNIPLTPGFSVSSLVWMEMGGVYAVANLRGGGEYGEEWHQGGMKRNKQNVFDDFIAAAEYLVAEKYTAPAKLSIHGGSNGGLLVGACMTQRPDLFGACVPAVGVLDMLRFHKFTIGWAWVSDYGSPDNADEFATLYAYSPYHNLKSETRYPATLVVTSDHDDRVVPAHSFKFAAALQAAQAPDGPPTLIRIETRAGHGAGKPTAKIIEEAADIRAFLVRELGMTLPENFCG